MRFKITVNAAGLSRGAYTGLVSVQVRATRIPQAINIPVTFVVGTSESTVITADCQRSVLCPGIRARHADDRVRHTVVAGHAFRRARCRCRWTSPEFPPPSTVSAPRSTTCRPDRSTCRFPMRPAAGLAILGVNNNGQVASFPFTVAPAAPGLFTAPDGSLTPSGTRPAGPDRGRLHHRRRRHHHVPDHRRESAQRHRDRLACRARGCPSRSPWAAWRPPFPSPELRSAWPVSRR